MLNPKYNFGNSTEIIDRFCNYFDFAQLCHVM